jgi:hypothetical protein
VSLASDPLSPPAAATRGADGDRYKWVALSNTTVGVLPTTMTAGLASNGVPLSVAQSVGHLPPVSILFAAFLGHNPIEHLVGPQVVSRLSAHNTSVITGRQFFPQLI